MSDLAYLPESHRGFFRGPNRLWLMPGTPVSRSDGTIEAGAARIAYTWAHDGKRHEGTLELFGPHASCRGLLRDTFHAESGLTLHGLLEDGLLRLFTTYPAGDGPDWGWRIELDLRDPEHLVLRMFNCLPGGPTVMAVELRGARVT